MKILKILLLSLITVMGLNANYVDGSGMVFIPNPLVSAGVPYGGCYSHNNGQTNSCLDGELISVTLRDITYNIATGLYELKGPYCEVVDINQKGYSIPALSNSNGFNYTRADEEFASVMCYYHIDLCARRIIELGYPLPDGLKKMKVNPHSMGSKGGNYNTSENYLNFRSNIIFVSYAGDTKYKIVF